MHMSPMVEGEVERAKRKRATVIVTRWIRITITPLQKQFNSQQHPFPHQRSPDLRGAGCSPRHCLLPHVPGHRRRLWYNYHQLSSADHNGTGGNFSPIPNSMLFWSKPPPILCAVPSTKSLEMQIPPIMYTCIFHFCLQCTERWTTQEPMPPTTQAIHLGRGTVQKMPNVWF